MAAYYPTPEVTSADRLGLTLFFAVVLHAVVILGITFSVPDPAPGHRARSLEITLVQSRSDEAPEAPDYLAQANHQGSGNQKGTRRPAGPQTERLVTTKLKTGMAPEHHAAAAPKPRPAPPPEREVMSRSKSEKKLPATPKPPAEPVREHPRASELIARSMEMASLSAEIRQRKVAYEQRLRHKHISASTQEYRYASYMENWRAKVERVGRLHYPDEAKRQRLSGNLLLDVALNPDGTVRNITLHRSSGLKVLDDAAMRIVRLAEPFAPFPDNIRKETDVLHITRTWIFKSGASLYTK